MNLLAARNPVWLLDLPQGPPVAPPVVTRAQTLPFTELTWQDFERLCLRLAKAEGKPDHWQLFGEAGEEQGGIDIYVRPPASNRYVVWQAKRHRTFTAAKVKEAVRVFLAGEWAVQSDRFVLATAASLRPAPISRAVEEATKLLAARGIAFVPLDGDRLSERLKVEPEIVDDFFDRVWVERFCGREAADSLRSRLGRQDHAELRGRLSAVYEAHFASVDPGVVLAVGAAMTPPTPLPLTTRFVPPDLLAPSAPGARRPHDEPPARTVATIGDADTPFPREVRPTPAASNPAAPQRHGLEPWSGRISRAVVIGTPGSGKSTLLRFLALDMLSREPRFRPLRERFPGHLPIWVSFPFWTRHIAATESATAPLEGALSHWLQMQGEPDLIPMVARALADGRVVLLVDGIDEWFDEAAAGTALTLLSAFAQRRRCPVIMSSRPYGERVLRNLDSTWERWELAPLTTGQQVDFAATWFEVGGRLSGQHATAKARAFVAELRRSSELAELAGTPLLLSGLIALRLSGASLPRTRFRAYSELTVRLLDVQPTARDSAALRARVGDELDRDTRQRAFAALAFHIQEQASAEKGLDAISKEAAVAFFRDFLVDALALQQAEAHRRATQLIQIGEQSLGLLVEKSPREVGFLHRVFQEFLAAQHLSARDLDVQLGVIQTHASEARWRDVLYFAVCLLTRPSEVDTIVALLERLRTNDPAEDRSLVLLLAEIAFGTLDRRPGTVRRLAETLFAEVETGTDATLRRGVLQRVIGGLGAEATSGLVRTKLRQWSPEWHRYGTSECMRVIADWPEAAVDGVLWRNLCHADYQARHQAALALAKRHGGDAEWRDRLTRAVRLPQSAESCAATITALTCGWQDDVSVPQIVEDARRSLDPGIMLTGISPAIAQGRHSDADLHRLLDRLRRSYAIPDGYADAIVAGWSGSSTLKHFLLEEGLQPQPFGRDMTALAIRAFPQDDDIAKNLVAGGIFENGAFSFYEVGDALAVNFKGHARLVAAIEAQSEKIAEDGFTLAKAARIAPTPLMKHLLLLGFHEQAHHKFWYIGTLVEEWGLEDPEVKAAAERALTWPLVAQAGFAHLLPSMVGQRGECRDRLLEILRVAVREPRVRADFVLKGLSSLDVSDDREALTLALQLDISSDLAWAQGTFIRLLEAFPTAAEVIALALGRLRDREGLISVIALCQGHSPAIREAVLDVAAPLPESLRLELVDRLTDHAIEDDAALDLLAEGGRELATSIIGHSLLAEARARLARAEVDEPFLTRLKGEVSSIGPFLHSRRPAGLAALMLTGRKDAIATAIASGHDPVRAPFSFGLDRVPAGLREVIAEHWSVLEEATGREDVGKRLGMSDAEFLGNFAQFLDQSDAVGRYAADAYSRLSDHSGVTPEILRYGVLAFPNAPRTLELCLAGVRRSGTWVDLSVAMTAAELLGRNYGDSTYVLDRLLAYIDAGRLEGPLAALCEGWPESQALDAIYANIRSQAPDEQPLLPDVVALKVVATKSDPDIVARNLSNAANNMDGGLWDGPAFWTPAVVRRIRRDDELAALMVATLSGDPTASEKLSFAALLTAARGFVGDVSTWCASEISRSKCDRVPEVGLDVTQGRRHLVLQRLRELARASGD